jgi:hypothetical protein
MIAIYFIATMAQTSTPAILNARTDIWFSGGLSVVVLLILAALGLLGSREFLLQEFLILSVLVNGTHFMASYRLLYSSREFAATYPWASYYVPAFLVIWALVGLALCSYNPSWRLILELLAATTTLYLALHYTGQAWGMMSSFAFLEGIKFEPGERQLLRRLLRLLAIWHVIWGMKILWPPPSEYVNYVRVLDVVMNTLAFGSLVAGLVCLYGVGRRCGRSVPLRVVTPFVAIHVWYGFLYCYPQSIFWVQIFHALQYLPFPLRVELNRVDSAGGADSASGTVRHLKTGFVYFLTLAFTSAIIFGLIPWISKGLGQGYHTVWVAIACVINIHHYFIDGCIWHISTPVVRQDLFAHTRPAVSN